MRRLFAWWLALTVASFSALAGIHLYFLEHSRRFVVTVDISFAMKNSENNIYEILNCTGKERYAEFMLYTTSSVRERRVHGWRRKLTPDEFSFYGERNLKGLGGLKDDPSLSSADFILVTNAPPEDRVEFSSWRIIDPDSAGSACP